MANVRSVVEDIKNLGPLPAEVGADVELLKKYDALYRSIARPVSDDEAEVLIGLFGDDGCYGLASSLMHLIETAPGWPLNHCLPSNSSNLWVKELRDRAIRSGYSL